MEMIVEVEDVVVSLETHRRTHLIQQSPTSGTRNWFHGRQFFHRQEGGGGWFRDDPTHYIYWAFYFNYYYFVIYNERII